MNLWHGHLWQWICVSIDNVNAAVCSRVNCEVHRTIFSTRIQPITAKNIKNIDYAVQMDNDAKHTAKVTQEFLKVKNPWIFYGIYICQVSLFHFSFSLL